MHSELGGGRLGHLALVILPQVYATLSNVAFIFPVNPGPGPIVPPGSTATVTTTLVRLHKEELLVWREYNNVNSALRQQLIGAVDKLYLRTIQHRMTGFANVSIRSMIRHLLRTYGNITPTDLAANDQKFRAPYDPGQPIEILFSQIEDTMDFADAGGTPYSANQIVTNAYQLVFNTGLLPEACRDWRKKPADQKTWAIFKVDFADAHQDLRLSQGTAQEGGYHSANNAMDAFVARTADAFANLATASAADRQTLANLTATNTELLQQLSAQAVELATLRAARSQTNTRTNTRRERTTRQYNNKNYCWSHGYDISKDHTSQNCRFKHDGHKAKATRENILGGSVAHKALVM